MLREGMWSAGLPPFMRELEPMSVSSESIVIYYRITIGKTIGINDALGVYA